jgi:hypothetical protein
VKKPPTEEQIAKEDHDNGECGSGCKWCHEKHMEFVRARIEPKGFYASRYMTIGFRA